MRVRNGIVAASAMLVLMATSANVKATDLTPGHRVNPDSNTISGVSGNIVADTGVMNYANGYAREIVVKDSATGGLDFVYQVQLAQGDLARLSASGFAGFSTNVSAVQSLTGAPNSGSEPLFTTGNQNVTPVSGSSGGADRSSMAADHGNVVGFNFDATQFAGAGATSYVLIVRTDATKLTSGNINLIDSSTATLSGFAPNPEPASLVLFGSCFLGLGAALGWRRLKRAPVCA